MTEYVINFVRETARVVVSDFLDETVLVIDQVFNYMPDEWHFAESSLEWLSNRLIDLRGFVNGHRNLV